MSAEGTSFYFYRGRVALYALLRALGVGPGDEVIIQAFTCLAVPMPILALGARPVYGDIDPRTFTLDPRRLASLITARTRAIVVQHTYGIPADMDAIAPLARKSGLTVIEDCCHALGSTYRGRELGTIGDAAFFSYEWGKPLTIGLGGSAVVNSEKLRAPLLAQYSEYRAPSSAELLMIELQYYAHKFIYRPSLFWPVKDLYHRLSQWGLMIGNFRTLEFDGKVSSDYLKILAPRLRRRLEAVAKNTSFSIQRRRSIARRYDLLIEELGLGGLALQSRCAPVLLRYPMHTNDKLGVLAVARQSRVEVGEFFRTPVDPLSENEWRIARYEKGSCPIAEAASRQIVTLPVNDRIDDRNVEASLRFIAKMAERGCLQATPSGSEKCGALTLANRWESDGTAGWTLS